MSDSEMIAEYLQNHKITVVPTPKETIKETQVRVQTPSLKGIML